MLAGGNHYGTAQALRLPLHHRLPAPAWKHSATFPGYPAGQQEYSVRPVGADAAANRIREPCREPNSIRNGFATRFAMVVSGPPSKSNAELGIRLRRTFAALQPGTPNADEWSMFNAQCSILNTQYSILNTPRPRSAEEVPTFREMTRPKVAPPAPQLSSSSPASVQAFLPPAKSRTFE